MANVNNLGHTGFLQCSEVSLWPFQGQRLTSPTAGQKSTSLGGCWYLSLPGQKDLWCQAALAVRKPLVRCGGCSLSHTASSPRHTKCAVLWMVPHVHCCMDKCLETAELDSLPNLFCLNKLQVICCVKPIQVCLPSLPLEPLLLFCKARAVG